MKFRPQTLEVFGRFKFTQLGRETDFHQPLAFARDAAWRAASLAGEAERYAQNPDYPDKVAPLAAAGALWADVARAHAAIAAALPADDEQGMG